MAPLSDKKVARFSIQVHHSIVLQDQSKQVTRHVNFSPKPFRPRTPLFCDLTREFIMIPFPLFCQIAIKECQSVVEVRVIYPDGYVMYPRLNTIVVPLFVDC